MYVNIDVQSLCRPKNRLRGIPYYTINLINSLVKRNNNDYSVSFFDFDKQNNYKQNIIDFIGTSSAKLKLLENNSIDYNAVIDAIKKESNVFGGETYKDMLNTKSDVFHFPNPFEIPHNLSEIFGSKKI